MIHITRLLAHTLLPAAVLVYAVLHGDDVDEGLREPVCSDPFILAVAVALESDVAAAVVFAVVELIGSFIAGARAAARPDGPEVVARVDLAGDFDVVFGGGEGEADFSGILVVGYGIGGGGGGVEGGRAEGSAGREEEEEGESGFWEHGVDW